MAPLPREIARVPDDVRIEQLARGERDPLHPDPAPEGCGGGSMLRTMVAPAPGVYRTNVSAQVL
jgi:hypothetical protein